MPWDNPPGFDDVGFAQDEFPQNRDQSQVFNQHGSQQNMSGSQHDMSRSGCDGHLPIDSMQGLDLGSQHGGNQYGPMDNLDIGPHGDISFGNLDTSMPPQQAGDNSGLPQQWFDTDL